MSDFSISIVSKQSDYKNAKIKVEEMVNWLVSQNILKPTLSKCVLRSENDYSISAGAKMVVTDPNSLPFYLEIN